MGGMTEGHVSGLAVLGHDQPDRRDVALAHAGRQELELAGHCELRPVYDVDLARKLRRDPQLLAVRRRREPARAGADHHVLHYVAAVGIDHVHEIAHFGGDVEAFAVLGKEHAFRLRAGRHLVHDDVLLHVDDRERRAFLVGDIEPLALLIDREGFRAWAGGKLR